MARFNLSLLFVVLAAWTVTVSHSAPIAQASDSKTSVILGSSRVSDAKSGQVSTSGNNTETVELPGKVLNGGNKTGSVIQISDSNKSDQTPEAKAEIKTTSLQCNIARAVIITDLQDTAVLLSQINTTDATVAKAIDDAKKGVQTAGEGIKNILTALISGETPPAGADGRGEVDKGLGIIKTALTGLNSTETDIKTALEKLEDTIAAGDEVVATCR
ncbi:hypothetical protein V5O48_017828 [Marasmius crinis-equi]|uniref:Uncharacterized protein n=1 Tax=Marasmius crinis-equi TaxID=585013 RepID=A0ABR3EN09_9AGAR